MRRKNDPSRAPSTRITANRRQILEGFGALAATAACSSGESAPPDGSPATGGSPAAGAANNVAGTGGTTSAAGGAGKGGGAGSGTGGSQAGTSAQSSGGSGGTGQSAGSGGQPTAAGSGGTPGAAGQSTTGGTNGAGAGGTPAGGTSGGAQGGRGGAATGGNPGAGGTGGGGELVPLTPDQFGDAPTCTLTPTDGAGEGPFFVHDDEAMDDVSLFETNDIRRGHEGIEFQLQIRVLDQSDACGAPVAGVEVYVWHTDALGFYSGFNNQNPDQAYSGAGERTIENEDRFCRGAQITNADGVVAFRTLYPGWYAGRPIHIHFLALKPGSGPGTTSYRSATYHVFTTQMYFEEAFSRDIHENNAPYNTRASGSSYEQQVKPSSAVRPKLTKSGSVVVGTLNIITDPATSRR